MIRYSEKELGELGVSASLVQAAREGHAVIDGPCVRRYNVAWSGEVPEEVKFVSRASDGETVVEAVFYVLREIVDTTEDLADVDFVVDHYLVESEYF